MRRESNGTLGNEFRGGGCREFNERLILLVAGELERDEEAEVRGHIAGCVPCQQALTGQTRLVEALAREVRQEPSPMFLARCRANLEGALDAEEERGTRGGWAGMLFARRWWALHPALTAVLLLLIGFAVGSNVPRWLQSPVPTPPPTAATTPEAPLLSDQELRTADVAGINLVPSGDNAPPQVEVQLRAQHPMVVSGSVDNHQVKRLLLYVLENNRRFGPDLRLNSVELLKARINDSGVRRVLCQAARTDRNPAVRLKALEALSEAGSQKNVQETLLHALQEDSNPGVRIEAINGLRAMAEKNHSLSDPRLIGVLRERMHKDPNRYIRLQSAAAVRDLIGPHEKF